MPRIIISLAIALALVLGTIFIKDESSAHNNPKTALIATEINTLNAPAIAQYAQQLQSEAVSDSSTTDAATDIPYPSVNNASSTPAGPVDATQELSQNLFTQYMSLKESGVDMSDTIAQQLATNLLSQNYTTGTSTTYTQANLIVVAPTVQNITVYGNELGSVAETPLPAGAQPEANIFQTFAQTNNDSVLTSLTINIKRYTEMQQELLLIGVPSTFVQPHLTILNTLSEIIHDTQVVQTSATDPVGAESALSDYQNAVTTLTSAFSDEKTLFLQNNISFSSSTPGYTITK